MSKRLDREKETVKKIIQLHCKKTEDGEENICDGYENLIEYALERLDSCPFGDNKPICARCKVHCYKPEMRDKIRIIMRKSGYKMLFYHPVLLFKHILDQLRDD